MGGVLFSVMNLSSSDFTMTNAEVVGDNIQNSIDLTPVSIGRGTSTLNRKVKGFSMLWDGSSNFEVLYFDYTYTDGTTSLASTYSSPWVSNPNPDKVVSNVYIYVSEGKEATMDYYNLAIVYNDYYLTSNIEQTIPITTTETYNSFRVEYVEILNGGSIVPYLLIGSERTNFANKEISLSDVMSDTQIKFGSDLSGSRDSTPQLSNNITFIMEYIDSVTNTVTSSSQVVLSVSSDEPNIIKSNSPIANLGNNIINFFFTPLGFGLALFVLFSFSVVFFALKNRGTKK